jgi:capsular exopolysaccharide synthesis family protein
MGDVFNAMNRAKRQSDENSPPDAAAPSSADDTTPALDLEGEQKAQSQLKPDDPQPGLESPRGVAAAASEKSRTDAEQASTDQDPQDLPATSLNGYSSEVVTHHDRGSVITEQYRAIRTQILARGRNRQLQTTIITSAAPNEGKSVTTINLGITFSELRNKKTLLIEGDLRRPAFARLLKRDAVPGLLQVLRGEVESVDQAIHPTVYDNLQFIASGGHDAVNSTELLSSPQMVQLIDRLRDRYDYIFIDTPPVLNVTDSSILGAISDQTVLVVRLNKTPSDAVERAKRLLRASNCEVAGVVLTHQAHTLPRYLYRYRYAY